MARSLNLLLTSLLLCFIGALLMSATASPWRGCRILHRWIDGGIDITCCCDCSDTNKCDLEVLDENVFVVYLCMCTDGTMPECPSAVVHHSLGITATCFRLYEPCTLPGSEIARCRAFSNPFNYHSDSCICEDP